MAQYQMGYSEEGEKKNRMAGNALLEGPKRSTSETEHTEDRTEVTKYWQDKNDNPQSEPETIKPNVSAPSTIGRLSHPKQDTSASDWAKVQSVYGKSGLNEAGGKQWADKWSQGYDKQSARPEGERGQQFTNMGINNANRQLDTEALAKTIDQRPIYHQAQGDVARSQWAGDIWNKDYTKAKFEWPTSLEAVKAPELDDDKYLDMIKDID
jgi:hypothetical protein